MSKQLVFRNTGQEKVLYTLQGFKRAVPDPVVVKLIMERNPGSVQLSAVLNIEGDAQIFSLVDRLRQGVFLKGQGNRGAVILHKGVLFFLHNTSGRCSKILIYQHLRPFRIHCELSGFILFQVCDTIIIIVGNQCQGSVAVFLIKLKSSVGAAQTVLIAEQKHRRLIRNIVRFSECSFIRDVGISLHRGFKIPGVTPDNRSTACGQNAFLCGLVALIERKCPP